MKQHAQASTSDSAPHESAARSIGRGASPASPAQLQQDDSPRQLAQRQRLAQLRSHAGPRNQTGLPEQLKSGIESLSGVDMSDVQVHRHSPKPAQLQAHAYAQGNQIHLAPGQDAHLPHEAWHVVQQRQGRVKPTSKKGGVAVNDSPSLEREADQMGSKALQMRANLAAARAVSPTGGTPVLQAKGERTAVLSTRDATRSAAEPIRRGNRRGSITSTGGRSSAKLEISYKAPHQAWNTGYRNKVGELKAYVKQRMMDAGTHTDLQADALLNDNDTFVQAKAVEEISVGNCGEFAMVVYSHLIQNTDSQYVYRSAMAGNVPGTMPPKPYDHCFVMTSPVNMPVVPRVTDATGFDRTSTTIADAWDGYQVMTLGQFMNGGNAYRTQLNDNNIVINEASQATGTQVLPPAVLGYIRDWAVTFNHDFNVEMGKPTSTYATVARAREQDPQGFNTNGSNIRGVDDKRSLAQRINNATPAERSDVIASAGDTELFAYINTLAGGAVAAFLLELTNPRIASYLNTKAIGPRLVLLAALPDAQILYYVSQCWNKGFFQQFALASYFPYKADVFAALPAAQAYRLLQQLSQGERTSIMNSLSNTVRNAIDAEAPPPEVMIV